MISLLSLHANFSPPALFFALHFCPKPLTRPMSVCFRSIAACLAALLCAS